MKRIASSSNPLVKTLRRLARPRKREAHFVLEGKKLVDAALESDVTVESIVVAASYRGDRHHDAIELTDSVYREVSTLETPEGILAVARRPAHPVPRTGLIAVAAGIQDPGNLGALARVVEATGATALVVLKGSADPFGPKAVRGSMGSVLRIVVTEVQSIAELDGFRKIALVPRGGSDYRAVDWSPPCAVVLGSESSGLDDDSLSRSDTIASIPMGGEVDSLNVAIAAGLVLYEATRRDG